MDHRGRTDQARTDRRRVRGARRRGRGNGFHHQRTGKHPGHRAEHFLHTILTRTRILFEQRLLDDTVLRTEEYN